MPRVPKEESYQKQLKALQLRLAARTYKEIADALGYANESVAYKAVHSAMKKTLREPAQELRDIETDRVDKALSAVWPRVIKGDDKAIHTFLRLSDHKSKLLGLYAPTQTDITSGGEVIKGYTILANPDQWDDGK
jgi:hypothetical protein